MRGMGCLPGIANVSLPEEKLVTVTAWHLLLFVTANFVSSFFLGRRHAFTSMFHMWTVKQNFGLHHSWLSPTISVFLLRNFDKCKQL